MRTPAGAEHRGVFNPQRWKNDCGSQSNCEALVIIVDVACDQELLKDAWEGVVFQMGSRALGKWDEKKKCFVAGCHPFALMRMGTPTTHNYMASDDDPQDPAYRHIFIGASSGR